MKTFNVSKFFKVYNSSGGNIRGYCSMTDLSGKINYF